MSVKVDHQGVAYPQGSEESAFRPLVAISAPPFHLHQRVPPLRHHTGAIGAPEHKACSRWCTTGLKDFLIAPLNCASVNIHPILRAAGATERTWAMTKFPTTSEQDLEDTIFDLRVFAPSCTLVICYRDPAAVALSLAGRYGAWNAQRALSEAETQRRVVDGWLAYCRKHRGRVIQVPMEDFTTDPERFVRRILGIRPTGPLRAPRDTRAATGGFAQRLAARSCLARRTSPSAGSHSGVPGRARRLDGRGGSAHAADVA